LRRAIISRPAIKSVGGLDRLHRAVLGQMEDRERASGRIAADGGFLHIEWQPGDLQPCIVLI
jgi:hypothetical protein